MVISKILDQIIKDIKPKTIKKLSQLTYLKQQKGFRKDVAWKRKTRNRASHKQPAWNLKFINKLRLLEMSYLFWNIYQNTSM